MDEINYAEMLKNASVKKGMVLDIACDIFNITKISWKAGKKFDPDHFIDMMCEMVGDTGTVLIRVFNWDFCHDTPFDIRATPSQVGSLGNVALKRNDFKRTRHPIYSWMVHGNNAESLCKLDNIESFAEDSVFAWEHHNDNAYQIVVGSPKTNGITLFHYIENVVGVPYRYHKNFTGEYIDEKGNKTQRTYSMYVRRLDKEIITDDSVYMKDLLEKKIRTDSIYEGIPCQVYHIPSLCSVYEADFRKNIIPTGVIVKEIQ